MHDLFMVCKKWKEEFQQKLLKSIAQQLKIQEIKLKEVNINNAVVILKSLILGNIFYLII